MSDMASAGQRRSSDMAGLSNVNSSEIRVKRTKIVADPANPSITVTLPDTTGTLALEGVLPPNGVTLDTNQTITGDKTFDGDTSWNGVSTIGPTGTFKISNPSAAVTLNYTGVTPTTLTLPNANGTLMGLAGNQTLTGNKTWQGQFICTRASSSTVAASPQYINPSNTGMIGGSTYRWFYLTAPPTSGTALTASTFTIAGAPTTPATNNYAMQVIGGAISIPLGTVAAPSLVFGTNNGSGIYSVGPNVINVGISGTALLTVNSTGMTLAGNLNANGNTFCRDNSGNYMLTRALKGVSTAAAGVITFQMTQLNGSTFGADSAGVFMVTMARESGDFTDPIGANRSFWSAMVERSAFAGGKANIVQVLSAINITSATITAGGLITITLSGAVPQNSPYAFTQMQICY